MSYVFRFYSENNNKSTLHQISIGKEKVWVVELWSTCNAWFRQSPNKHILCEFVSHDKSFLIWTWSKIDFFRVLHEVWPCLIISPASVTISRRLFVQGSLAVNCYHMKLRRGLDISDTQMIFWLEGVFSCFLRSLSPSLLRWVRAGGR